LEQYRFKILILSEAKTYAFRLHQLNAWVLRFAQDDKITFRLRAESGQLRRRCVRLFRLLCQTAKSRRIIYCQIRQDFAI
jgi:hypothetical protein